MNLLSIQDNLKGVSDQDLARMMQSPDSTAPSYLVLSEIRRRKDMRTRAGDMPSSTVAEDLVDIPQTYSDREGIRSLRVPGYEEEQQNQEADSGAGIEAMRAGGMVMMAEGGEVNLPLPPAAPGTAGINMQDIMRRNMELIPGIPEELMNRLREGRTNEPDRRREAQSNALVEAGLRIAASNNPRLAGAIGEGALPAVQGYTQQRAQIRQDQRADLQSEMAAAQADIQRRYMAGQLSATEYRSAMEMTGRREIAEMQIAAQRAQSGASDARADRRLQTEVELDKARRHGLGQFTPQEWERMSEPQRQAVRDRIELTRPRNADVGGYGPLISGIRPQIEGLRNRIRELGPKPDATRGYGPFARPNPRLAQWEQDMKSLQDELNPLLRLQETAFSAITAPRAGAARSGAGNVAAPQATLNYVEGVGAVPIQ